MHIADNHYDCCYWVMKMGLVIVELQDLETHLNLIKDLTGSLIWLRIWLAAESVCRIQRRTGDAWTTTILGFSSVETSEITSWILVEMKWVKATHKKRKKEKKKWVKALKRVLDQTNLVWPLYSITLGRTSCPMYGKKISLEHV